ncbi:preprotein translocase subunit SecG [Ferrimonas lipolytica]|uniref:Protein-export membrane protein SecG n=1 Tax=Ferrimonas lipolytica TaxID=2724191 RepID=A0A6H1UC31_9GAMM|nr:preprotein translocase subunit SecG [Ferrimonas lipolytica]QIZ75923.1 preprotein translocase subunit SecG [Ferrimonas lipolytica]
MLFEILMVCYLLVALAIIGLVLIQQGKGAGMGASFGSGASGTLFGSSGSGNFLSRSTAVLATLFFVLSLLLGRLSSHTGEETDDWNTLEVPAVEQPVSDAPASDVPATDVPN